MDIEQLTFCQLFYCRGRDGFQSGNGVAVLAWSEKGLEEVERFGMSVGMEMNEGFIALVGRMGTALLAWDAIRREWPQANGRTKVVEVENWREVRIRVVDRHCSGRLAVAPSPGRRSSGGVRRNIVRPGGGSRRAVREVVDPCATVAWREEVVEIKRLAVYDYGLDGVLFAVGYHPSTDTLYVNPKRGWW